MVSGFACMCFVEHGDGEGGIILCIVERKLFRHLLRWWLAHKLSRQHPRLRNDSGLVRCLCRTNLVISIPETYLGCKLLFERSLHGTLPFAIAPNVSCWFSR